MSESASNESEQFLRAVKSLCGEANEAARLAGSLFDGTAKVRVRRALARCMELMEQEVLVEFESKFPGMNKNLGGGE